MNSNHLLKVFAMQLRFSSIEYVEKMDHIRFEPPLDRGNYLVSLLRAKVIDVRESLRFFSNSTSILIVDFYIDHS